MNKTPNIDVPRAEHRHAAMIQREARHLLGMADEIVMYRPDSAKLLSGWRERLFEFANDPRRGSIADEAALDRLSIELRSIWMNIAHDHTGHHLKSPLKGDDVVFPLGWKSEMKYERVLSPAAIERRCVNYRPDVKGWGSAHLLFRSGMSTIVSFLQNIQPYYFTDENEKILVDFFGGYFETKRVFDLFTSSSMAFQRHDTAEGFLQACEHGDSQVLFFEPVSYDWDMEVLDLRKLLNALQKRRHLPKIIVIDTTITGDKFPLHKLLNALPGAPRPVVIQITSGLKLDQEGLELANAGIFSLFCEERTEKLFPVRNFLKRLSGNRKINGTGLSAYELAALDVPWFLNRKRFIEHSTAVFEHNKELADRLAPLVKASGGLFKKVSHPGIGPSSHLSWAVAPFVVLHFRDEFDHEKTHDRVTDMLLKHAQSSGYSILGTGMSFGFRSHRFEIIKPETILHPKGAAKGLLKVAMGRRKGPMAEAVITLLESLVNTEVKV